MEGVLRVDSSGHDMHHAWRVFNLAMKLIESEGGDELVVGAAALTHDAHRVMKAESGHFVSPGDSLPTVERILREAGFPEDKIASVLHCVELHEEYGFEKDGREADTIELKVIQDADNLDAIGAVGVARCFVFGGAHGVALWNPEVEEQQEHYDKTKLAPSSIHHFYDKLFRLKDNMNTSTAKKMAEGRHEYMVGFAERFKKEWKGEL